MSSKIINNTDRPPNRPSKAWKVWQMIRSKDKLKKLASRQIRKVLSENTSKKDGSNEFLHSIRYINS